MSQLVHVIIRNRVGSAATQLFKNRKRIVVCLTIWSLLRLAASGFSNSFPCAVSYGLVKKRIITRVWTRSVEGNESWAKFTKLTPFVVEGKKREGKGCGFSCPFWAAALMVVHCGFLPFLLGDMPIDSVSQSVSQAVTNTSAAGHATYSLPLRESRNFNSVRARTAKCGISRDLPPRWLAMVGVGIMGNGKLK